MGVTTIGRKVISIILASALLVIIATLATLNNNLKFLNPSTTAEILVFTSLSAVVFLLFVSVLVMLVRNVLKLYADQRSRVMGTRLRTRMLWGAVLVSLLPIAFMTSFSYVLMNRAVDHWFSNPVTEMRDDSNQLALELSQYTTANARAEADSIAAALSAIGPTNGAAKAAGGASETGTSEAGAIEQVLGQHEITLQGGFCLVYDDGSVVANYHLPRWGAVRPGLEPWLPTGNDGEEEGGSSRRAREASGGSRANADVNTTILESARRTDQPLLHIGNDDYVLGMAGMQQGRLIVVGLPVPAGMTGTVKRLRSDADTYWMLFRNRRQIRGVYMQLLLMLTTLALFASTWLALHLSKQVTKPVEALADAMDQIATGDYAHRVQESATEELGELVHSFNRMVADLESSRAQVQESTIQISQANATLEARRSELETMLETIPNGVATLDAERRIVLANRALSEMMDPGGQARFLGMTMEEVFPEEVVEGLDRADPAEPPDGLGGERAGDGGRRWDAASAGDGGAAGECDGHAAGASRIRAGAGECDGATAGAEAVGMEGGGAAGGA